jgi:hypothetical protein
MSSPPFVIAEVAHLLQTWLATRLPAEKLSWLIEKGHAAAGQDRKALYLTFGLIPRHVGKGDLQLSTAELSIAASVRPGWQPELWTVDQAARSWLLLQWPADDVGAYVTVLDQLFTAGEVHELVALYQALPLLPHAASHQLRCAEGIRTNIRAVFDAIAHRNPYPAETLSEPQWNQLVLKCLFVGAKLDPVTGLDTRANAALAVMLTEFAHERWAAGRPVSPELWRPVGPFATGSQIHDLQRVLTTGTDLEQQAARLALQSCRDPEAARLLSATATSATSMTWSAIAAGIE